MPSEERLETPPAGSYTGLLAALTSRAPDSSCNGVGAGMRSSEPSYWRELNVPFLSAVFPMPLMFRIRSPPSAWRAIAEGTQAVGTAPATFHVEPLRRIAAMALLPPQAT